MARMVLLHHELPTGESHYDWLLERAGAATPTVGLPPHPSPSPDDRCLLAFRVRERLDEAGVTSFEAERMPDHRRLYLTFEGELSEGRGVVRRVAGGVVRSVAEMPGGAAVTVRARWTNGSPAGTRDEWTWAGVAGDDGAWRFQRGRKSHTPAKRGMDDDNPYGDGVGHVIAL